VLNCHTRFDEVPNVYIDATPRFMLEKHWWHQDPNQSQEQHDADPKFVLPDGKYCCSMVMACCKVEMLRQVLAKPLMMYGLTVSRVCNTGVCPYHVRGHRVEKAALQCCMVQYTYISHAGSSLPGETVEEEKKKEMAANGGKVLRIESRANLAHCDDVLLVHRVRAAVNMLPDIPTQWSPSPPDITKSRKMSPDELTPLSKDTWTHNQLVFSNMTPPPLSKCNVMTKIEGYHQLRSFLNCVITWPCTWLLGR
jgi:hypothetical protein